MSIVGILMVMASIYLLGSYIEKVRIKNKDPKGLSEILIFILLIGGIALFFIPIMN
jgi:hypothetical protein